jgi:hypothetical protein
MMPMSVLQTLLGRVSRCVVRVGPAGDVFQYYGCIATLEGLPIAKNFTRRYLTIVTFRR